MAGVLDDIETLYADLRKSERKVADRVLAGPELVLRQSLASLATAAGVSEPTVIRFCRALGCSGFPDFRIRLAQGLAAGAPYIHSEVTSDDDLPVMVDKILNASINALSALQANLDRGAIERATRELIAAKRIDCYGVGASIVAAMDAHQKFMRLGVPASLSIEGHLQTMSAATLRPGDVALCFSYTGQIRDIVRTAKIALEQGAVVIAVTRQNSMLSRLATLTIAVDTPEDTFVYAPMTTRLAHLACIDILATSVAVARGVSAAPLFQRIKSSLDDQHIVEMPMATSHRADTDEIEDGQASSNLGTRRSTSG
ncbi:MAG TPA: SIS domain-containing protein [Devosiaceae bacterium]|jgi:RpiR family carbohydrate utilization transcriptional regulator